MIGTYFARFRPSLPHLLGGFMLYSFLSTSFAQEKAGSKLQVYDMLRQDLG